MNDDDDDIPPPLVPSRPPTDADSMFIPFTLADAPRLQLDFLSRNSLIPEASRNAIKRWLDGYNARLVRWISEVYGDEGVQAADTLSRATAEQMNKLLTEAREKATRDLFAHLEEEMGRDE